MPLVITLLLYASAALALIAGGSAGLLALVEPANRGIADIVATGSASTAMPPVLPLSDTPPAPGAASQAPAWIVSTPRYDLPAPQIARRDVEQAKKMADRQRKARMARQTRPARLPDFGADVRAAYGYAGPPRSLFRREMP
jgi:hypothetical protein